MPSSYRPKDRWKPTKRRSTAQKNQLAQLNSRMQGEKENTPPIIPPSSPIEHPSISPPTSPPTQSLGPFQCLKAKVADLKKQCYNAVRREKRAKAAAEEFRRSARESMQMSAEHAQEASKLRAQLVRVKERNEKLTKTKKALHQRVQRAPKQRERAVARAVKEVEETSGTRTTFQLKGGGVIPDPARDTILSLVADANVPVSSVESVIRTVSSAIGVEVEGSISKRSIGRIVREGGIASTLQLVDEIQGAKGVTLSSDGTSHKNIQYQGHHVTYTTADGENVTRFVGITHELNHASDTQLQGWQELIQGMYEVFNHSGCKELKLDWREFLGKVKGMLTDHAEDQKKLVRLFLEWKRRCERELRGENALASLPPSDVTHAINQTVNHAINAAGGLSCWEKLSPSEQHSHTETALRQLYFDIGEKRFAGLTPMEKESVDFFVWAGCCMHKELNAVKGGDKRMTAWWNENGIEGPLLLMNRDNAAAASEGSTEARSRAIQVSARGAVKALNLTGAVFRHKDDKKGQQDSLCYYLESLLGYFSPWPDTSNTRYQSHCNAASEWLVHRTIYISYLEILMHRKESQSFTNIELNVYNAFFCPKTAKEMACLSTWANCIGHPYMREVRSARRQHSNILDLGPLHAQVACHLTLLIANPDLAIGPSASFETATLDKKPFERPEAFYVVKSMANDEKQYPHLSRLLSAFLQGALETFTRFSAEFDSGGVISQATPAQRALARMETTNDANEGILGTFRIFQRRAPRMSLAQFNARLQYKKNKTGSYMKSLLTRRTRQYLRKQARIDDANGAERKRRLAQVAYDQQTAKKNEADAKKKREAAARKINELTPILVVSELAKMRVTEIDLQIRWHRGFDQKIPRAKDIGRCRKDEKLVILTAAVERYLRGEAIPTGTDTTVHAAEVGENGCSGNHQESSKADTDELEEDEMIY